MVNKKLIVFVDRGNISRSPIAESIFRKQLEEKNLQDQYDVISRRTQGVAPDDTKPIDFPNLTYYPKQYSESKKWLDEHGIDLSNHRSTPIDSETARKANIMLAMDSKTRQSLLLMFPEQERKVHLLSTIVGKDIEIEDPEFVDGRKQLEQIFNGIENMIVNGLPRLLLITDEMNETNKETTGSMLAGGEQNRARKK